MSIFRDDLLEGRVAFVTGGGSGICRGITKAFLSHGASACIVSRSAERLSQAATELSQETGRPC